MVSPEQIPCKNVLDHTFVFLDLDLVFLQKKSFAPRSTSGFQTKRLPSPRSRAESVCGGVKRMLEGAEWLGEDGGLRAGGAFRVAGGGAAWRGPRSALAHALRAYGLCVRRPNRRRLGGGGEGEGGVGVGVSGATLKFLFELVGRMVSALWTG